MEEERPGHHDAAVETGPKVGGSGARLRKITFKGRRNLKRFKQMARFGI